MQPGEVVLHEGASVLPYLPQTAASDLQAQLPRFQTGITPRWGLHGFPESPCGIKVQMAREAACLLTYASAASSLSLWLLHPRPGFPGSPAGMD